MKRLPYATALISIAIAVPLWLLATWLDSDTPWPAKELAPGNEIARNGVRPDSPVAHTMPNAADCVRTEDTLRARIDDSQYCTNDDDCTLFDYGYPIQCLTSVAKGEITALRLEYRNYEQNCEYRVYYDCPTGEMERRPVCHEHRCAVELQSNEILEKETRDYLGIDKQ